MKRSFRLICLLALLLVPLCAAQAETGGAPALSEGADFPDPGTAFSALTGVGEGLYYEDAMTFYRAIRNRISTAGLPAELIGLADGMLAESFADGSVS